MCGICGVYYLDRERKVEPSELAPMSQALAARGPDDHVLEGGLGFGFAVRRLAVVDRSAAARPPYRSGARTVLFNGEIYAHERWRTRLEDRGVHFRSRTDGEILPHLLTPVGDATPLAVLEGMYGIACYDAERHVLALHRDPSGEKPLYFASIPGGFAFASTAAAVIAHPAHRGALDEASLVDHLAYGFQPEERTVHEDVRRVEPGGTWIFRADGAHPGPAIRRELEPEGSLEDDLRRAVEERLVADRPIGLFLSGGIDSGTLASFLRDGAPGIEAFTARFGDSADEVRGARLSAAACRVKLTEVSLGPEVLDHLGPLTRFAGEPLGDASLLTLHGLCRAAANRVVVVLTGDGADEWFHGYDRLRFLTTFGRVSGRRGLAADPSEGAGRLARAWRSLGVLASGRTTYPTLLQRFSRGSLGALWKDAAALAEHDRREQVRFALWSGAARESGPGIATAQWDRRHYLPHDLLLKSDLAGMAASLELRAPFLDARVRRHAPRQAPGITRRGKESLRELALLRGLPGAVVWARKRGFRTPLETWFRQRGGALALLEPWLDALAGRVHVDRVRELARSHDQGLSSHASRLYHLLSLAHFLAQHEENA